MSSNTDISKLLLAEMRGINRKLDRVGNRFHDMEVKINDIQGKLSAITVVQRVGDEIMRKSANSINIIIRIVSGLMNMSTEQLGKLLVESSALKETVRPTLDWEFDLVPGKGCSLNGFELLVAELSTIVDSLRSKSSVNNNNNNNKNNIVPINTPSINSQLAQPTVSCSTLQDPVLSQEANPTILPNFAAKTSSEPKTITPVSSEIVPNCRKESKEEEALRRKYKNKYRYLDNVKKPTESPMAGDKSIPLPYRHPLYRGKKYVCITSVISGESVVRPLSCVQPRIVLKDSDHKNLAAVLPRQRSTIEKCKPGYLPKISINFPEPNEPNCESDVSNPNESNTKKPNWKNTSLKKTIKTNSKNNQTRLRKLRNVNRMVTRKSSESSVKKRAPPRKRIVRKNTNTK